MRLRADWNFQKCRLCCVDCAVKNIVLRVDWNFQLLERNPNLHEIQSSDAHRRSQPTHTMQKAIFDNTDALKRDTQADDMS